MIDLSIVIPSYLEEENLRILVPRIKSTLDQLSIQYEILIIDTMEEMDNTKLVAVENCIKYINRRGGNNYGDAVRTGIQDAEGDFCLFMDADGSHSPESILDLYKEAQSNDIVIASRYIEGGGSDNSRLLILMSLAVNVIYSIALRVKIKDVSNSFKIYRSRHVKSLNLTCSNFDIVEELLIKVIRKNKGIRIKEIPYMFKERMFGTTKRNLFKFIFSYIFTLSKLMMIRS